MLKKNETTWRMHGTYEYAIYELKTKHIPHVISTILYTVRLIVYWFDGIFYCQSIWWELPTAEPMGMKTRSAVRRHCCSPLSEVFETLSKEHEGHYPDWNELSDQRLAKAILMLRENERRFIYQHVFEEKTFREIGYLNGLSEDKVENIYYYAVHKIRKWMGGGK